MASSVLLVWLIAGVSRPKWLRLGRAHVAHRTQWATCWSGVPSYINHFSTTSRCSDPAHYDVSIRQAARAAFVTSSFKIFSIQTFPRCGATCCLRGRWFNGVNFVYHSVEVYFAVICEWGAVAQGLERATDNRVDAGSNPSEAVWKLGQFPLPHFASVFRKRN